MIYQDDGGDDGDDDNQDDDCDDGLASNLVPPSQATCCTVANQCCPSQACCNSASDQVYTGCLKKNALSELCGICVGTKFFGYFGYFEQASLQPSF